MDTFDLYKDIKARTGGEIYIGVVGPVRTGKSTFINGFAGQQRAKAADKPGVTRGKQWITVDNFELLDMPGVLWRKFENNNIASNLAFIGSIKDDILDTETLACTLVSRLRVLYPELLTARYRLTDEDLALADIAVEPFKNILADPVSEAPEAGLPGL